MARFDCLYGSIRYLTAVSANDQRTCDGLGARPSEQRAGEAAVEDKAGSGAPLRVVLEHNEIRPGTVCRGCSTPQSSCRFRARETFPFAGDVATPDTATFIAASLVGK